MTLGGTDRRDRRKDDGHHAENIGQLDAINARLDKLDHVLEAYIAMRLGGKFLAWLGGILIASVSVGTLVFSVVTYFVGKK